MNYLKIKLFQTAILLILIISSCYAGQKPAGIKIGWAIEDITPEGPVSLKGQYYERISKYVESPLKVTALAIEGVGEDGKREQLIMISADVVSFKGSQQDMLRDRLKQQLPDFDVNKLFLNATHNHSSLSTEPDSKYNEMLVKKMSEAAVNAWKGRKIGGISYELEYVVVGHNRRVEYADGSAQMYGETNRPDFIGLEGPEDPAVQMLFCWDINEKLTGIIVNVACPAQVTEAKYYVSADYWGKLRDEMEREFPGVYILPQCSAAGDISPRDLVRDYKPNEPDMWDVSGIIEIGKRLIQTISKAYPDAKRNIKTEVVFEHKIKDINIPTRRYSKAEYEKAKSIVKKIRSKEPKDPNSSGTAWNRFLKELKENEQTKKHGPWDNKMSDFGIVKKQEALIEAYEQQDKNKLYPVKLHAIRLGNVAFATNPFELFVDYGFRIQARSKATQTMLIQLAGGNYGGYLPTRRAVSTAEHYRGYSATVNNVGPEGGQMLVDETVNAINSLFEKE